MPPRDVRGSAPKKRKPRRSSAFGPLGRADAPLKTAQHVARRRVERAQRNLPERPLPSIPVLAHPTQRQAEHAVRLANRAVRRIAAPQRGELRQDPRSRAKLAGAVHAQKTLEHNLQVRLGMAAIRANPGAYGLEAKDVHGLHRAAAADRIPEATRNQLAAIGRGAQATRISQAKPYKDRHVRAKVGPATVDLSAASADIGRRLANNPAAAFVKGINAIAQVRPLSDKGVVTRSINDLLTYPAAAIPTGYALATHPKKFAEDIAQQVTHPLALTKEHPLFGALLAHGGVSALGRTGGAAARSGALGAGAKRAASTQRDMIGLAGESGARIRTPRSYSKDVIRKAVQVAADKRLQPIRDAEGRVVKDARGRPVRQAPEGVLHPFSNAGRLQRKRADFIASRANARERHARAEAVRAVQAAQPTRGGGRVARALDRSLAAQPSTGVRVLPKRAYRPEKDVVAMAMEGTLRAPETFREDLLKERARLEDAYKTRELDPLQRRTNRIRARTIDRVLNDPSALRNADGVFRSARTLAAQGNALTHRLVSERLLSPDAAARAKLFPYAQSHMGAKVVEHKDGSQSLRAADGTFLSNDQIRAHMRSEETGPVVDPRAIAYLPHRNDVRGARAYHQQFRLQRPNLDRESRSGAAYEAGAVDASFDNPLEHIVRSTTTLARTKDFDRLIGEVGIKHPEGRYFTWKEAEQYARFGGRAPNEATNQRVPGEPQLVPVRAHPAKYQEARARAIQNEQDVPGPGASDRLVREQTSRFDGPDPANPDARNVVLVPKTVADRLAENLKPSQSFDKAFQGATAAFRTTVLPFSTKWLTGNVVEAVLRSGIAGVSPRDPFVARKLIREMRRQDPSAAVDYLSHLLGGLLYGEQGLTVRRTAEDVAGKMGGTVAHSLPGRAGKAAIKGVTEPVFQFNKGLEKTALYAALGKHARAQMQEMTGSWFKAMRAQDEAIADLAKGLKGTEAQERAARYLDETLGQYSRFAPGMRRAIQGYAPFLPWYLNSVRFVLHTLPVRHPVKTAVLTQAEAVFQADWEAQHKDIPQRSGLKTAIPRKGGFVDAARYTPFGLLGPAAAGDLGAASGVILPQTQGLQLAVLGLDPFGEKLKVAKTKSNPRGEAGGAQQLLYGLNQALESYVPGVSIARRAREGGRKSLANSTVFSPQTAEPKPGQPRVSAANRIFNPFRPVYISASRTTAKGGTVKGNYWQRTAIETGAHSSTALPDEEYWRALAAGK